MAYVANLEGGSHADADLRPERAAPLVKVSSRHSRYLERADGTPFIPIGLNLCFPRFVRSEEEGILRMESWLRMLAAQGGNFFRLWLGHPFFDFEPRQAGVFDKTATARLIRILDLAHALGLSAKLTLDHFRGLTPAAAAESFNGAATFDRTQYHVSRGGPAATMDDFWKGRESRALYLRKLDWLASRVGGHPAVIAWELWNEVNACQGEGWREWTEEMLPELKRRFPGLLALQSLGSFCADYTNGSYRWLCALPGNDVVQVHRYLDLGAEWEVCHGAVDVLSADAVRSMREWAPHRPVLLAEGGAVEPNHAGPLTMYEKDPEGVILHDVLFAPFFAGAAGCGQAWHWDFYIERHSLWWQFGRFSRAIEGFDPVGERAEPVFWETPRLRVYALRGKTTCLLWLRDRASCWKSELLDELPGAEIKGERLRLPSDLEQSGGVKFYDPWSDTRSEGRSEGGGLLLPDFSRSLVVRVLSAEACEASRCDSSKKSESVDVIDAEAEPSGKT